MYVFRQHVKHTLVLVSRNVHPHIAWHGVLNRALLHVAVCLPHVLFHAGSSCVGLEKKRFREHVGGKQRVVKLYYGRIAAIVGVERHLIVAV